MNASATDTSAILSGFVEVTVDNDYSALTDKAIVLQPGYSTAASDVGAINLTITDSTSKIASVTYSGTVLTTDTSNANSLEEAATVSFESGTATILRTAVKPNSYEVTFAFYDAAGNTLYKCKEAVNVFGGFTTDTWYGNSAHMQAVTANDETTYAFTITDGVIAAYGTEIVPSTDYVLYDYNDKTNTYGYCLTDDVSETPGTATATTTNNSFCFNSQGIFYALIPSATNSTSEIYVSGGSFSPDTFTFDNNNSFQAIACDLSTDMLYFKSSNTFFKCEHANLPDPSATKDSYEISLQFSEYSAIVETLPETFAIYANKVYMPVIYNDNSAKILLITANLADATQDASDTSKHTLTLTDSNVSVLDMSSLALSSSATIPDILYQDGAVYLLVRDVSSDSFDSAIYSRGAVIKYDTLFGTVKTLGWTSEPTYEGTSIPNMYAYSVSGKKLYKTYDSETQTFGDQFIFEGTKNLTQNAKCNSAFPAVYAPAQESTEAFFGPQKFIAVKPKKLVIADDGVAFYVDTNNALAFKNVNRAVTVDLEAFAIVEAQVTDTSASFEEDKTLFKSSSVLYTLADGSFYYTGGFYEDSGTSISTDNIYIGISCETTN